MKQLRRGFSGPYTTDGDVIKKPSVGALTDAEEGNITGIKDLGSAGMPAVCFIILMVELCERLAFYTFTGTQQSFLEHSGYSLAQSGGLTAAMSTLCMAWALFAGWVADVALGRFLTIVVLGGFYVFGSLIATYGALPGVAGANIYLVGVMIFVPMGTAGIKANISNFGADQYDVTIPSQKAAQEKFFNWFYLSINLGSAVAYGYLTTMGSNGGLGVPKEYGYFAVYGFASVCMLGAIAAFACGRPHYRMQPVKSESAMGAIFKHVAASASRGSQQAVALCVGGALLTMSIGLSVSEAVLSESPYKQQLTVAAFACAILGVASVVGATADMTWMCNTSSGREQVGSISRADAARFLRLLPTLILGSLAFNALYNSMQYWYQQQACQMNLVVAGYEFAGSFFMIADCVGIVIATPIALNYVNPALERRMPCKFGHGSKFGFGMLWAVFSVMMAVKLETFRREAPILEQISNCAPPGVHMSDVSAAWMFVPFLLMGIGEIYTQPVLMHFAYANSPESLRTLAAVMSLLIGAVSNAVFTVLISALGSYVPDDLNNGHLEYGYYANIMIGALLFCGFLTSLNRYERGLIHEST